MNSREVPLYRSEPEDDMPHIILEIVHAPTDVTQMFEHEAGNLKKLCDDIFGELENLLGIRDKAAENCQAFFARR